MFLGPSDCFTRVQTWRTDQTVCRLTVLCIPPPGVRLFEDPVLIGAELTAGRDAVLAGVAEPRLGGVLRGGTHDGVALAVDAVATFDT